MSLIKKEEKNNHQISLGQHNQTRSDVIPYEQNIPYDQQLGPAVNLPANPFNVSNGKKKEKESIILNDSVFKEMEKTYLTHRYTIDPAALESGEQVFVGDMKKANRLGGKLHSDIKKSQIKKKRRLDKGSVDDVNSFKGPWAGYEGENDFLEQNQVDQEALEKIDKEQIEKVENMGRMKGPEKEEKTKFHGVSEYDYLGRTYIHAPTDLAYEPPSASYIPKKLIHTWKGHTKGVNKIKFFPNTAHLLLSCSMDSKIKIWDVHNDRSCLRTYMGHSKAVRDIAFSHDGKRFLSASYDKMVKLWDTETGQCIKRFTTHRVPYCLTFHPDKPDIFLCGSSDKKIYQFEISTGEVTQEYDQHLGAVNTIQFIDHNRRFVTTSDDKTLRMWEYDIPVVIKYIADPSMHSMPAVALSPSQKWLAYQSLDNQIMIYGTEEKLSCNRNKNFRGHIVAGYACQPSFSPDERFVSSGDSTGKVYFWDWKTCKVLSKLKAHNSVVMCNEWHPFETSKMATCSWDGTIKLSFSYLKILFFFSILLCNSFQAVPL